MLVNNEFGKLKSVLLCLPTYMDYMPVNAITNRNLEKGAVYDSSAGVREMKELAAAMASTGTVIYFEEPQPDLQGQAWTRDMGFMSPAGALLGKFQYDYRPRELDVAATYLQACGFPVAGRVEKGVLEGGDTHFLDQKTLLVGDGRSTDEGARDMQRILREKGYDYDVVRVNIPREFHHLDAIFVIISEKTCVACTEALPEDFIKMLRDRQFTILDVPIEEARNVGCNVVSLGRDIICSSQRAAKLNARLRAMGFTVLDPCLDMLHGQGGGPRCLSFPLERENVYPV